MTQAPKRIRLVFDKYGDVRPSRWPDRLSVWDESCPEYAPHTEHFYQLEENMTQEEPKTMTAREAWEAMARGECVQTAPELIQAIRDNALWYWAGGNWIKTFDICDGPYSIVPDPSKPEASEYSTKLEMLLNHDLIHGDVVDWLEKNFVRKGEK